MIIRQGDVLLRWVEEIPAAATPVEPIHGRLILAEGEVTGHHHSIAVVERSPGETRARDAGALPPLPEGGVPLDLPRLLALGDERYLDLPRPAELEHQEHATLLLPEGRYQVLQQREYHPAGLRQVAD